jgi:hypothetical protein
MIGKQRRNEIRNKSRLIEELRTAEFDQVVVWDDVTSGQEVTNYIRRNSAMKHSIIIVSYR